MGILDYKRLSVFEVALSGRGVTVVSYGAGAFQPVDDVLLEDVGDEAHLTMGYKPFAI
jgi:hypothetical protein